ncbi:MAG: transglutaminase family protein [Myxococcales bacterium]|nr:transglutaminase family protein [Myxococcales bacterium]
MSIASSPGCTAASATPASSCRSRRSPFAPADTLARGFGDCKDKATLLVALLRAAKIPADVALLSTGPGTTSTWRCPAWASSTTRSSARSSTARTCGSTPPKICCPPASCRCATRAAAR